MTLIIHENRACYTSEHAAGLQAGRGQLDEDWLGAGYQQPQRRQRHHRRQVGEYSDKDLRKCYDRHCRR